jgi:hypothetical protein
VLDCVGGAVDAGTFAVPDGEDSIRGCPGIEIDLLGAPDRRCRKLLVDARLEDDVVRVEIPLAFVRAAS